MPYGTRAPKELLHHLPALTLHRPSVSADPTELLPGARGSRLLDRRPPRYRCPAVPGLKKSARAILMALGSSVLPSVIHCLPNGVLRTAGTALLRTALTGTATAMTAVPLTAAPDHCGPPGPVVSPVAVLRQPWLRNSTTAPSCQLHLRSCCPAVRLCQALLSRWVTRETITTPLFNVYSGRDRFSWLPGRGRPRWPVQDLQSSLHRRPGARTGHAGGPDQRVLVGPFLLLRLTRCSGRRVAGGLQRPCAHAAGCRGRALMRRTAARSRGGPSQRDCVDHGTPGRAYAARPPAR